MFELKNCISIAGSCYKFCETYGWSGNRKRHSGSARQMHLIRNQSYPAFKNVPSEQLTGNPSSERASTFRRNASCPINDISFPTTTNHCNQFIFKSLSVFFHKKSIGVTIKAVSLPFAGKTQQLPAIRKHLI
jgi:hypothetical protein